MNMHNPPHPGEFIAATYMEPCNLSCRYLATQLGVAASTLNRILKKQSGISPEMALRQPRINSIIVVLPEPLGPIRQTVAPVGKLRLTFLNNGMLSACQENKSSSRTTALSLIVFILLTVYPSGSLK